MSGLILSHRFHGRIWTFRNDVGEAVVISLRDIVFISVQRRRFGCEAAVFLVEGRVLDLLKERVIVFVS